MTEKQGKTALVLSGGGSRGAYEIGVWQALKEMNIKIDMVTGTSAGAINGAVISQGLFEAACEIWKELETDKVFDFSEGLIKGGARYTAFKDMLLEKLDEEAIRGSEVDLGIVTVEFPSMEPKYLWKEEIPEGQLIDYILASASCFPAVQSYEIGDSRYIDGGYSDNMPVGMALERGAANIIAVNLDAIGILKKDPLKEAESAVLIQSHWDLGNWLKFDKVNTKRIMRLGYLDTMKTYGAFDGSLYTFIKGDMDKRSLNGAEQAAAIFELDPGIIYGREIFLQTLAEALDDYEKREEKELAEAEQLLERSFVKKGPLGTVLEKSALAKSALNGFLSNLAKLPPANSKTLILLLARHLKGSDVRKSLLFSRPALALFTKEISAAYFLVKAELV